jgi:hypothetical protein
MTIKRRWREMKNKITDLNNHLFAQLERLGDESLTPEQVTRECERADAIVAVSEQIIRSATVSLKAAELIAEHGFKAKDAMPQLLEAGHAINGRAT